MLTFLEARLRRTLKDKLADSVALLEGGKGEAKTAKKASGRKRKSASRQEAARKGAVGGSRRLNRPPAGGGAFPERRAGS